MHVRDDESVATLDSVGGLSDHMGLFSRDERQDDSHNDSRVEKQVSALERTLMARNIEFDIVQNRNELMQRQIETKEYRVTALQSELTRMQSQIQGRESREQQYVAQIRELQTALVTGTGTHYAHVSGTAKDSSTLTAAGDTVVDGMSKISLSSPSFMGRGTVDSGVTHRRIGDGTAAHHSVLGIATGNGMHAHAQGHGEELQRMNAMRDMIDASVRQALGLAPIIMSSSALPPVGGDGTDCISERDDDKNDAGDDAFDAAMRAQMRTHVCGGCGLQQSPAAAHSFGSTFAEVLEKTLELHTNEVIGSQRALTQEMREENIALLSDFRRCVGIEFDTVKKNVARLREDTQTSLQQQTNDIIEPLRHALSQVHATVSGHSVHSSHSHSFEDERRRLSAKAKQSQNELEAMVKKAMANGLTKVRESQKKHIGDMSSAIRRGLGEQLAGEMQAVKRENGEMMHAISAELSSAISSMSAVSHSRATEESSEALRTPTRAHRTHKTTTAVLLSPSSRKQRKQMETLTQTIGNLQNTMQKQYKVNGEIVAHFKKLYESQQRAYNKNLGWMKTVEASTKGGFVEVLGGVKQDLDKLQTAVRAEMNDMALVLTKSTTAAMTTAIGSAAKLSATAAANAIKAADSGRDDASAAGRRGIHSMSLSPPRHGRKKLRQDDGRRQVHSTSVGLGTDAISTSFTRHYAKDGAVAVDVFEMADDRQDEDIRGDDGTHVRSSVPLAAPRELSVTVDSTPVIDALRRIADEIHANAAATVREADQRAIAKCLEAMRNLHTTALSDCGAAASNAAAVAVSTTLKGFNTDSVTGDVHRVAAGMREQSAVVETAPIVAAVTVQMEAVLRHLESRVSDEIKAQISLLVEALPELMQKHVVAKVMSKAATSESSSSWLSPERDGKRQSRRRSRRQRAGDELQTTGGIESGSELPLAVVNMAKELQMQQQMWGQNVSDKVSTVETALREAVMKDLNGIKDMCSDMHKHALQLPHIVARSTDVRRLETAIGDAMALTTANQLNDDDATVDLRTMLSTNGGSAVAAMRGKKAASMPLKAYVAQNLDESDPHSVTGMLCAMAFAMFVCDKSKRTIASKRKRKAMGGRRIVGGTSDVLATESGTATNSANSTLATSFLLTSSESETDDSEDVVSASVSEIAEVVTDVTAAATQSQSESMASSVFSTATTPLAAVSKCDEVQMDLMSVSLSPKLVIEPLRHRQSAIGSQSPSKGRSKRKKHATASVSSSASSTMSASPSQSRSRRSVSVRRKTSSRRKAGVLDASGRGDEKTSAFSRKKRAIESQNAIDETDAELIIASPIADETGTELADAGTVDATAELRRVQCRALRLHKECSAQRPLPCRIPANGNDAFVTAVLWIRSVCEGALADSFWLKTEVLNADALRGTVYANSVALKGTRQSLLSSLDTVFCTLRKYGAYSKWYVAATACALLFLLLLGYANANNWLSATQPNPYW